jgi:hypothetical protein
MLSCGPQTIAATHAKLYELATKTKQELCKFHAYQGGSFAAEIVSAGVSLELLNGLSGCSDRSTTCISS